MNRTSKAIGTLAALTTMGAAGALYVTAGINDEHDGLFGDLVPNG